MTSAPKMIKQTQPGKLSCLFEKPLEIVSGGHNLTLVHLGQTQRRHDQKCGIQEIIYRPWSPLLSQTTILNKRWVRDLEQGHILELTKSLSLDVGLYFDGQDLFFARYHPIFLFTSMLVPIMCHSHLLPLCLSLTPGNILNIHNSSLMSMLNGCQNDLTTWQKWIVCGKPQVEPEQGCSGGKEQMIESGSEGRY